jgi:hypothetical protein
MGPGSERFVTFGVWGTCDIIEWIAAQPWCNGLDEQPSHCS